MENKKTARIALRKGLGITVEYETLEDLCASIHEVLSEIPQYADSAEITLPDGKSYRWQVVLAHYRCYGTGSITETELVNLIFRKELLKAK